MVFNNVKRKICTNWKTFLNKGKGNFLQLHWICKMTAVFSGIVNIPHRISLRRQPDKLTSSTEFKLFFQHTLNIHAFFCHKCFKWYFITNYFEEVFVVIVGVFPRKKIICPLHLSKYLPDISLWGGFAVLLLDNPSRSSTQLMKNRGNFQWWIFCVR